MTIEINTKELKNVASTLCCGDRILLSGTVYTARDAAHKRFFSLMEKGCDLPFQIDGACIYYAGPTPAKEGMAIGSCGPTTSGRMDKFSVRLLDMGLSAMIGKGERSPEVIEAVKRNGALYLCAVGGCGALGARCITECRVIAFEELGCESVKQLTFDKFPLYVGIDTKGSTIFKK